MSKTIYYKLFPLKIRERFYVFFKQNILDEYVVQNQRF